MSLERKGRGLSSSAPGKKSVFPPCFNSGGGGGGIDSVGKKELPLSCKTSHRQNGSLPPPPQNSREKRRGGSFAEKKKKSDGKKRCGCGRKRALREGGGSIPGEPLKRRSPEKGKKAFCGEDAMAKVYRKKRRPVLFKR